VGVVARMWACPANRLDVANKTATKTRGACLIIGNVKRGKRRIRQQHDNYLGNVVNGFSFFLAFSQLGLLSLSRSQEESMRPPHNLANKQKTVDQKLRLAMRVQRVTEAAKAHSEMTHQIRQYHLPRPTGKPRRHNLVRMHWKKTYSRYMFLNKDFFKKPNLNNIIKLLFFKLTKTKIKETKGC